jgi:hypothetical protein
MHTAAEPTLVRFNSTRATDDPVDAMHKAGLDLTMAAHEAVRTLPRQRGTPAIASPEGSVTAPMSPKSPQRLELSARCY